MVVGAVVRFDGDEIRAAAEASTGGDGVRTDPWRQSSRRRYHDRSGADGDDTGGRATEGEGDVAHDRASASGVAPNTRCSWWTRPSRLIHHEPSALNAPPASTTSSPAGER